MSILIEYYFNWDGAVTDVAGILNEELGLSLAPHKGDENDQFCSLLGMELTLLPNDLENDRELEFASYGFVLDMRTSAGAAYIRPIQVPLMAMLAFLLFRKLHIIGMLVFDTQFLLARYTVRSSCDFPDLARHKRMDVSAAEVLFDIASQRPVEFPQHFVDLSRRLDLLGCNGGIGEDGVNS